MAGWTGGIPLFAAAEPRGAARGGLWAFAHGSTLSGVMAGLEAFACCDASGNVEQVAIPSREATSGLLPLSADGASWLLSSSLTLYAGASGSQALLTLWASGLGLLPGYFPMSGCLPLFARRPLTWPLELSARGPGEPFSGFVSICAQGAFAAQSGLSVAATGMGSASGSLTLFSRGY
jgi:hypothetical protein